MQDGTTKLHQLLAVNTNLSTHAQTKRTGLLKTFETKRHHFASVTKTFKPIREGEPDEVREHSDIQTSVREEINWMSETLAKAFDVAYQIDIANTLAKADVILENGQTILKDVPATQLLQLEKRLREIELLAKTIPTLDPAKGFQPDPSLGSDVYKARETTKVSTKKENKVLTLAPATDKHPAQVERVVEDVKNGTILEQEWSTFITVSNKSKILDNIEELIRSVSEARSRANEQIIPVKDHKIGEKLLNYIFRPIGISS